MVVSELDERIQSVKILNRAVCTALSLVAVVLVPHLLQRSRERPEELKPFLIISPPQRLHVLYWFAKADNFSARLTIRF